jgi:hypothetical protein
MSLETSLLGDVWDTVKPYIPKKEQLEVAESLLRLFDDAVGLDDIDNYKNEFDATLKAAVVAHMGDSDDDDEDYDSW